MTAIEDFSYEPVTDSGGKEGIVFFGHKGSGKTSAAYLLDGEKIVLSFDGKSLRAKESTRPDDKSITVFDARKYVSHFKTQYTESAAKNFDFVLYLLTETAHRGGCDWIIIDGLDIVIELCEMKMRYDKKLGPFEAFPNLNYWKDRKLNLRAIFESAFGCARKGVVFTTYTDKDEIVNDATLVAKKEVPKWMDIVMYDTDTVVKTQIDTVDGIQRFRLYVLSSKVKRFRTGDVLDVTNAKTLADAKVIRAMEATEQVNLEKAIKRKKVRYKMDNCPNCTQPTVNEMGVIHCTVCDWVHSDESD